ncbi:MAG: phosphoenolpyruvate synthase [Methanobacterium sp.]|nr:MAG: phosphoenolpyruvate synthase [Methanobacterium sp.]
MELIKGIGSSSYIGVGKVRKVSSFKDTLKIKSGEIVVISRASRDMISSLQKAGGVITDYGGITSHIAITLRELRIPCIVGCENATEILEDGLLITVDGFSGKVYEGFIEIHDSGELMEFHNPATSIKVNINIPELAPQSAPLADGVGSIRTEIIISRTRKHPSLLLKEGRLSEVLSQGVRSIVDAFYPKPVWFRTFDITSDEMRNLEGGEVEPKEANPLLGLRGIYKDLKNVQLLKAQFEAIKILLEEGYDNIGLKIPFLRDFSEYESTKRILKQSGLNPHQDLPVGISVETPSVVFTLDDFIKKGIDFVSIGMSDLTMCTLALDRRGLKVAQHFDLMHPAVLKMVEMTIGKCNKKGIECAICGHAATDEGIITKMVEYGISTISTNPDQILKVRKKVHNLENKIKYNQFKSINLH